MFAQGQGLDQSHNQSAPVDTGSMLGFNVVAISFLNLREPLDTGIALVPSYCSGSVDRWENWTFHYLEHVAPNLVKYKSYTIKDPYDRIGLSMKQAIRDAQYLFYSPTRDYHSPARILIHYDQARLFEKQLRRVKPLYDEYAMLAANVVAKATCKPVVFEKELFGTYADQVKDKLEAKTLGFYSWQALGSSYGPAPMDKLLRIGGRNSGDTGAIVTNDSTGEEEVDDCQMML